MGLFDQVIAAGRPDDLNVLNSAEHGKVSNGCSITPELIGVDHVWYVVIHQEPFKKGLRRLGVSTTLQQEVKDRAGFVDRPPAAKRRQRPAPIRDQASPGALLRSRGVRVLGKRRSVLMGAGLAKKNQHCSGQEQPEFLATDLDTHFIQEPPRTPTGAGALFTPGRRKAGMPRTASTTPTACCT